jgi:L-threonylcarbamoyladenylate synthase
MTIEQAAHSLSRGNLVAFPTETVYGLGADAENLDAINRLYEVKDRPKDHPVIVHIAGISKLNYWTVKIPEYANDLAKRFWPGPMTLLLPRSSNALDSITGGQEIVGVRIPSHPIAQELLTRFQELGGNGVVAPSANRFGNVSPTSAEAVREELGECLSADDVIIDGGDCEVGIESTIIDCTGISPRILRLGAITEAMINEVAPLTSQPAKSEIKISGSLPRHYSPKAKVLLDAVPIEGDGYIATSEFETPKGVVRLASPTSTKEFAHDLYQALRNGDRLGLSRIVIRQPEGDGLAAAIRDRLHRASN